MMFPYCANDYIIVTVDPEGNYSYSLEEMEYKLEVKDFYSLSDTWYVGKDNDFYVNVANVGNKEYDGKLAFGLYNKATGQSFAVGTDALIAPGGNFNYTLTWTLPNDFEAGEYQFNVYDYKDKTYRLLNDTPIELTVKTTSANLEIEEAEFLTNPWFVGQEGGMRVAIKNTGEADFDGSLLFDFLEQTTFDQVEYELDFSLKAGKRQEGKIMFAIPEDLTEGIYGVDIYERSQSGDRKLTSEPLVLQIKQYVAPTGVEIDCE